MNERIVYLGPFNNEKQNQLINKAIHSLKNNKGKEFYYLLPNGELLKKYRKNFINQVKNTFEINLFTFDNIVNEILGEKNIETIKNPIKNLIIDKVLKKLISENKLIYYKDVSSTEGFIHSINDIIGEIKRSLVYPKDYLKDCPDNRKFREIGLIYIEYEKMLEKLNLEDREGAYFRSIENLKKDNFLRDLQYIIIDEFYDFRPIELAILRELVNKDLDIYVNMPFDMENRSIITNETLKVLEDLGFTIEYINKKSTKLFEKVAYKLFSNDKDVFLPTGDIQIINGPTIYLELKRIFEEIKRLHQGGTKLEDIGIIITNPEYLELLYKVSNEERIPINIDKSTDLSHIKLIREILGILENNISNGSKFNLINRIKFTYFDIIEKEKRELYESILRALDFKDLKDLESLLENQTSINISQDNLIDLQDIIKIMKDEINTIPKKDNIGNYNQYIVNKFKEFNIKEKIINIYKTIKDERLFLKDLSGVNKMEDILSEIQSLPLFIEDISLEEYYIILKEHLDEEIIIEEEGNINGINILNPVNSRGIYKDVIFITGLSQGSYPVLQETNYFLNEENLNTLKYIGIDSKSYIERLSNEEIKFASMIASCKDKLYLSYIRGDGDISLPSMFLDDLLELIIDKEKINNNYVDLRYLIKKDINSITNIKDLIRHLLYKFYNNKDFHFNNYNYPKNIDNKIFDLIYEKIKGEFYREKEYFNRYNGLLEEKNIIKDVISSINNVFSISYLESYSTCPYAFMLNNLFEIKPMERDWEDYRPIDIGIIYHEVLKTYYEYYLKDIEKHVLKEKEFNIEETRNYLEEMVYNYALEYEFNLESKKSLLILENIISKLKEFILEDLKRLSRHQLLPYEFEVDFGNKPKFYIENEDMKVPIIGRIDRIDKFVNEDKYVLIDYKSSTYGIRDINDMKIGLSLQLPVYIMSQKEKKKDVLAGSYGIINSGKFDIKLGLVDETSILTRRNKGAVNREEWNQLMNTTKDNIFKIINNINKGDFSVNPLECSEYCPYRHICRYEDVLEVEE